MITTGIVLQGNHVRLEPLEMRHVDGLVSAAAADPSLYRWSPVPQGSVEAARYIETALAWKDAGTAVPFAVIRMEDGMVLGSTRFFDLAYWVWPEGHPSYGRDTPDVCEIGYAWLTNVQNLMRGDKIRAEFEKKVLADVPQQIEEEVQRLIDWLVQKDLHEWQQVMSYLQRRRAQNIEHLVGEGPGPRETRRRELIDTVGKSVQNIVSTYDRDQEARELAASVETAVAQTALLEAGAVGLGALISIAVLSSSMDITGILAASTMAILGFFVIPFKRKQAKDNFMQKMQDLRTKLLTTLTEQFNREREIVIARLKDGVAPYTRYVNSELERIDFAESTLAELQQSLSSLRARAEAVLTK